MIEWIEANDIWFHFALFVLIALWVEIRLERYMDKLEDSYVRDRDELLYGSKSFHHGRGSEETGRDA